MQQGYNAENDAGYAQLTCAAATGLTIPAGCVRVIITPEAQAVRWRMDGTNPTAAVGYPLAVGSELVLTASQMTQIKFIEQTASAKLNVNYFKG